MPARKKPSPFCKHCKTSRLIYCLGLCYKCYYIPKVRARYKQRKTKADPHSPPKKATDAPPGSAQKQSVLRARARRGLSLWHPQDNLGPTWLNP